MKCSHLASAVAIASALLLQSFVFVPLQPREDVEIEGETASEFASVKEVFRQNFVESLERDGASMAVYFRGERVVNAWGGFADRAAGRRWRADTRTLLFSATKAVASVCIAMLVDRGVLRYEDRVSQHWPEYGQHGKNLTTIEDVLTHKAGLPYLDERVEMSDIGTARIREKLERARPAWPPGMASGYHAVTFGFILDEIVRKATGSDIATFFREEIASKFDLDMTIGVAEKDFHRSARITLPGMVEYVRDILRDPRIAFMLSIMYARFDDVVEKIHATHRWIYLGYEMQSVNDPAVQKLPLAAVTGAATADSAARLFSLLLEGRLLRHNHTLALLRQPTLDNWHLERVVLYPVRKGHGFFYEPHPTISGAYTFGHPGFGCQMVHVDQSLQLSVVYLTNGLKTGSGELCSPSQRILKEVYRVVSALERTQ